MQRFDKGSELLAAFQGGTGGLFQASPEEFAFEVHDLVQWAYRRICPTGPGDLSDPTNSTSSRSSTSPGLMVTERAR
jgi:hypothetical protein